jgi:hypothetical protein
MFDRRFAETCHQRATRRSEPRIHAALTERTTYVSRRLTVELSDARADV